MEILGKTNDHRLLVAKRNSDGSLDSIKPMEIVTRPLTTKKAIELVKRLNDEADPSSAYYRSVANSILNHVKLTDRVIVANRLIGTFT